GRAIFSMSASFQIEEAGLEHQAELMPDVPGPDELRSEQELGRAYLDKLPDAVREQIPETMRERIVGERPIEIRPVRPADPMKPKGREPRSRVWFRAAGALPDRRSLHEYMLAYASDF